MTISQQANGIWVVKDSVNIVFACKNEDEAKIALSAIEAYRQYDRLQTGR